MTKEDELLAYVGRRAYELAKSDHYKDYAAIELAIVEEGIAEGLAWLEVPGVPSALEQICSIIRGGKQVQTTDR
jgi:hypothetical protein